MIGLVDGRTDGRRHIHITAVQEMIEYIENNFTGCLVEGAEDTMAASVTR